MRKEYIITTFAILVLAVAIYTAPISQANKETTDSSLNYHSQVCVYKNNQLVKCGHNIVQNGGLNVIKECIGHGGCGASASMGNFSYIALGNITAAQAVTDITLANEWIACSLQRTTNNAYTSIGNGNWSISQVWTANASNCVVNTTGLFNATSGGVMFAQNNFTTVTLQANDQLNVTWTIWITQ